MSRPSGEATRPSITRRLCALGALLALAAAFVVAITALVRNPVELAIAVVLLVIATVAAWAALVRRRAARIVLAIVAVVALGAIAALPDLRTFVVLPLVLVLGLLAAAAARVALGKDLATPVEAGRVGPARRGVLLMNPRSGGGKVAQFDLENVARSRGITPVVLHRGDDLRALAEEAAAHADVIGMAGGDGSQALVADVARRHGLPFVCVPAGTRNHFALDLGLDRENVVAALDAYGEAFERRIDLALIGDRVFVNNASLGVYATVVQSPGYRDAKVSTVAGQLPQLLGPDSEHFDLSYRTPDGGDRPPADIVLVSNGPYRLDRLTGFGTRERLDTGALGIVTVSVDRARDLPTLITAELTGQIARYPGYRSWETGEFVVSSGQSLVDIGVDGEALKLEPPLRFRSLPGALRVRVPVDAPGSAPAALAPKGMRDAVRALFRVLAGRPAG
ncbi:diacylglycerol kinase family protein [Amycolatopsis sp. FDAARGOS 1241]|uniref:diacylglycerol/lipid kinase family protein n=1 Tax=Amycolatopsis sp. FDAARGOS 1241 TaxID=2778070 RepID=UPI00194E7569|nr:diacylglycerol kinase family protein [Amycolatopsis sp. FDAARGOS 1241]QRP43267.1 diacylglycerol kinase [Amycolatopsis sp. FDAARGOS 1241]